MKNKNGLTLIELLGVVVILAIIAIITIPIISNIIIKVRINALKDSAYGLIEASNLYYAQYEVNSNTRFDISNNEISSSDTNSLLKYKGSIKEGTVIIDSNGSVTICVSDGNNSAYKNSIETKVTTIKGKRCTISENSSIVYLDDEATITALTNSQLTSEIEELKKEIEVLKAKDEELDSKKTSTSDLSALDTKLSADISQIKSDISDIGDSVYAPVNVEIRKDWVADKTKLKDTGVSVTIPAKSYYVLRGWDAWGNAVQLNDGNTYYHLCQQDRGDYTYNVACVTSGYTESGKTVYLWSKGYNDNGTGGITGFYLTKQS